VVEVGDVYTNRDLGLTYRVVEVRDEDDDTVVTVQTLEEGVETYRTLDELRGMISEGTVVEADVDASEFDDADEDTGVEIDVSDDRGRYLKGGAIVLVALALAGLLVPIAGVVLKFAARFLIPIGIVVLAAYLLYSRLSGEYGA